MELGALLALTDPALLRITRVSVSSSDDSLDLSERCARSSAACTSTAAASRGRSG